MLPERTLGKLLLLTLTLEEAILRDDYQEADSLFRLRDLTLDALAPMNVPPEHPTVKLILEADRRLGLVLATRSKETSAAIRKQHIGAKVQRAYSHAS